MTSQKTLFLYFLHMQVISIIAVNSTRYPEQKTITIDLAKCTCTSTSDCDLTILKSSLLELPCNEGEGLCCPLKTTEENGRAATENQTAAEVLQSKPSVTNVRIYPINSFNADQFTVSNERITTAKSKSKRSCRCKSRGTCPHKYIDYGFGFHCTYNTVRCCIPEDEALENDNLPESSTGNEAMLVESVQPSDPKDSVINDDNASEAEIVPAADTVNDTFDGIDFNSTADSSDMAMENLNTEGELLITEVTNWKDENDYNKDSDCVCLPIQKCRESIKYLDNSIERRRDMLCPGDLIQCCGFDVMEEITKKKDDSDTEFETAPVQVGLPPYQQPIQLPHSDIPATNDSNDEQPSLNLEEQVSPPSLPTQYQTYEPSGPIQGYTYPQNVYPQSTYPTMISGPPNYQKSGYQTNGQNIGPWVNLASPSSSYSNLYPMIRNQYSGYPRGPYPNSNQFKSSKPGGLLDTLTQLLG